MQLSRRPRAGPRTKSATGVMKKFAVALMHLSMLALVCAIAAYWAIRILTPAPASTPPPPPAAALREADPVLAARMFGLVQAAPVQVALTLNVQALGAFAAGKDSAAILAVDGKPARVYLLNQDIASGAKLVSVQKDAVTIEQGGVRRDFALPPQPALGLGGAPPPPGYTREGMTLTAPSVAGSAPPAVAPRTAQPRPPVAPPQPMPQPQPQPQPQPMAQPQFPQPEQDEASHEGAAAAPRRGQPGRALSQ
jgi:general secretion pathway protein C